MNIIPVNAECVTCPPSPAPSAKEIMDKQTAVLEDSIALAHRILSMLADGYDTPSESCTGRKDAKWRLLRDAMENTEKSIVLMNKLEQILYLLEGVNG